MNLYPPSQSLARPTFRNRGDPERIPALRVTVIPSTRTMQQRGDMQDTVLTTADERTFLVRRHHHTVCSTCPLGNFEIRRLDAEPPQM